MTSKQSKQYTLFLPGGSSEAFSRKEYAIAAGEASGGLYMVTSPSGKTVVEVETKVSEEAPKPKSGSKTVAYTQGAKIFFPAMGAVAVKEAEAFGLEATMDKTTHTVTLTGGDAKQRTSVAKGIEEMWAGAYDKFKDWKKENKDSRKGFRDTSEGRKKMLNKEMDLLAKFAKQS